MIDRLTAATSAAQHAAVVLVHQERPPRQAVASVCSRRLRTTPPSWLTVRARSFPPTTCRSITVASSSARNWRASAPASGSRAATGCIGLQRLDHATIVRYDLPTFAGFSVSASWGEDDFWDVAARYAGEWNGIKVAAAAAYSESTRLEFRRDAALAPPCSRRASTAALTSDRRRDAVLPGRRLRRARPDGSVPLRRLRQARRRSNLASTRLTTDFWYVKAGLRERWTPLGHTVLYGEYEKSTMTTAASDLRQRRTAGGRDRRLRSSALGPGCRAGNRCGCHVGLALLSPHRGESTTSLGVSRTSTTSST